MEFISHRRQKAAAVGRDNADSRVVLLHYLAVSPNTGTICTKLTLTGSDFGTKKGKVLIGGTAMKVINWDASSITCEINKTLPQGPHDVVIQRKDPEECSSYHPLAGIHHNGSKG